jgi:hypothetical protein
MAIATGISSLALSGQSFSVRTDSPEVDTEGRRHTPEQTIRKLAEGNKLLAG